MFSLLFEIFDLLFGHLVGILYSSWALLFWLVLRSDSISVFLVCGVFMLQFTN